MFPISYWSFWFILHVYSIIQTRMVFTVGTWFLNFPGETCSPQWLGMTRPRLTCGPARGPPRSFLMVSGCFICLLSTYIHWSNVSLCHTFYIHLKLESSYSCHSWWDIIPRKPLSTIPSQMSYFTRIKTFGILVMWECHISICWFHWLSNKQTAWPHSLEHRWVE